MPAPAATLDAIGVQRAAPTSTPSATSSAAAGGSGPTRVQQFAYATGSSTGETSSTVPLGTSGTLGAAPRTGDTLVALISLDDNGGTPVVTLPAGWSPSPGGVLNDAWVHDVVATFIVGAGPPPSATFTYNERVGALITIVEVANTAGVDVVTSAAAHDASPWTTTSGTGSQSGLADLGLASFAVGDAILTPGALGGYTMLTHAGRHGDGNVTCGHSVGVYAANVPVTSRAVPAQTITWTSGSGSEYVIGQQILMKPVLEASLVPTPRPQLTPSPTPTPTPGAPLTSTACLAAVPLQNGIEYAATWAPYACTSPWNTPVSSNPTYATYSSAVIATEFASGNTQPVREMEAGPYDYGHPVYEASATDPLVNVVCNQYCGSYPAQIRLPAKARPALGTDAHLSVVQPDGTEIDMWATYGTPGGGEQQPQTRDWRTGDTVTAGNVSNCGNFASGPGMNPTGPAATAGGACLGAGLLRAAELLSGTIGHALFVTAQCAIGAQYPAPVGASTDACTSGVGPALGARLWYDVADATTNANARLQPWEKAILDALHDYGGYLEDDASGGASVSGIGFLAESGEAAWAFGLADPFAALASQGWSAIRVANAYTLRYVGADPWQPSGVDFAAHLHWLAPCSAHGTC